MGWDGRGRNKTGLGRQSKTSVRRVVVITLIFFCVCLLGRFLFFSVFFFDLFYRQFSLQNKPQRVRTLCAF